MQFFGECRSVMAMCRPEWLPQSSFESPSDTAAMDAESDDRRESTRSLRCMALDGNALESLEVGCHAGYCFSGLLLLLLGSKCPTWRNI